MILDGKIILPFWGRADDHTFRFLACGANEIQSHPWFYFILFFARLSKCATAADWLIVLRKCSDKILESSVSEI